ncbi:polyhydroxybutyrate depolymerase [Actinospica sp. MGRD01-02]|uniref:Polyhydroxybutyrate depolymerase n=1 Tax=Actinospica acidithermotolerans TaxID=2828514 RepID=A0A941EEU9_9ACTN|nr:PHB depolymerase family esterase [Actinospica acidithermotolerans]MBR7829192.1 polyhydroxybutyrate depolymerase [Actinospica acidithermotolerans]
MSGYLRTLIALACAALVCGIVVGCKAEQAASSSTTTAGTAPIPVGSTGYSLRIGGLTRTYHVYRPAGVASAAPLVVFLHGGFGSGEQAEQYYGWDAEADAHGFFVAYPDGYDRAWNVGGGCCGQPASRDIDDVAFISAMVTQIERGAPVDARRVFATGISNGGMMDYRLACSTTIFAAIGPDSATELGACADPARISVIHIHGTADHNIPYDGGPGDGYAHIDGPAVPSVIATWRQVDGCAAPSSTISGAVTTSVAHCPDGRGVTLITIAGAGHQWPGSPDRPLIQKALGLDTPSTALDATVVIWSFFAGQP